MHPTWALVASTILFVVTASAQEFQTEHGRIRVVTIAQGLEHPWGLAFLPNGTMIVTERVGRLRLVAPDGELSPPLSGLPEVASVNQGGLLDVAIDPEFPTAGWIYFSYAEPRGGESNATTVARARLQGNGIEALQVLFRQQPAVDSRSHFGGRLAFDRDGRLFITLGERAARQFIERAQHLDDHFGKVVRIERDGSIPRDNPFVGVPHAMPEIWSLGHRNPQGAAIHPATGELWSTEHGPMGGDELNVVRPGRNYGWPIVTYGLAYSGERIGVGTQMDGMEQPVRYWVPSIATSGLAFYEGPRFPAWQGNAFVGGLAGRVLVRLELDGERVSHEEQLLREMRERIRDVRQGPDGNLYLLTDSPQGKLLRVEPVD